MDSDHSDHNPVDMETEDADIDDTKEVINKEDEPKDVQNKNDTSMTSQDNVQKPYKEGRNSGQYKSTYGTAFPCKLCPYSYKNGVNLKAHMARSHPEEYLHEGNFQCDFPGCKKSCNSEMGLKQHKLIHKKEMEKMTKGVDESDKDSLPSNDIAEEFSKIELTSAKKQKKSTIDIPKYFCDFTDCDKSFSTEVGLKVHKKKIHEKEMAKQEESEKDSLDSFSNEEENRHTPKFIQSDEKSAGKDVEKNKVEEETSLTLLEAENIEKSQFALLWTAVFIRAKIHPNELIVIWTDSTFNILESADTFSQWTTISFNDLSKIDKKIFEKIQDVEEKLSEGAEENGMTMINMMEFGENDFFRTYVKKFSKKILVFNCPE